VLLARRLVEADVQFVQVNWFRGPDEPGENPCWDSHTNETARLRDVLVPPLDMAMSALMDDLQRTGKLDETLVVCMAEFGRTPKLNARAGRDHWGHVFSIALGGGGIRGGQAIGSSDDQGAWPESRIVRPQDVTATIFHALGYPADAEIRDPSGRPLPISRGEVIRELV
jgi:arylsulfatase A-like enzyme